MKSTHRCESCESEVSGWEETDDCESCEGEMCVNCRTHCFERDCLNKICQQCSHDYQFCYQHRKESAYGA